MRLTIKWDDKNGSQEKTINDQATVNIGRSRDNEIRLEDRRVSRRHASIYVKNSQWYLRNISSANLVRKGGQRLAPGSEISFRGGDILQIGPVQFHAVAIDKKSASGQNVAKLQCSHCNHIVDYEPHEFCPYCGRSLNAGITVFISQ